MGLIDATKAIESIDEIVCSMSICITSDYCHGMTAMKDAAIHAVENQPTVDAVPVVRCGDCKRWGCPIPIEMKEKGYGYCGALWSNTHENEYCAWGERKDDEKSC